MKRFTQTWIHSYPNFVAIRGLSQLLGGHARSCGVGVVWDVSVGLGRDRNLSGTRAHSHKLVCLFAVRSLHHFGSKVDLGVQSCAGHERAPPLFRELVLRSLHL